LYIKEGKTKDYSKIDYCYFCKKPIKSKISRHYKSIHSTEEMVKQCQSSNDKKKEINLQFERLKNLGNFEHNAKVGS